MAGAGNLKPFKKGQSGNPGGRPKATTELREMARSHTAEAVATLASVMRKGKTEQARVIAANALLDRGYGKAMQPIEAEISILDQLADADKRALLAALDALAASEGDAGAATAERYH